MDTTPTRSTRFSFTSGAPTATCQRVRWAQEQFFGLLFLLTLVFPPRAHAQSVIALDAHALPLPPGEGPYATAHPASRQTLAAFKSRLSYLHRPLELTIGSPDPDGIGSVVVAGAVLWEISGSIPLFAGLDAALNVGAHLYQWGQGVGAITGSPAPLPAFAMRDPRMELGWALHHLPISLRAFSAVVVPAGNARGWAGESHTRAELGLGAGMDHGRFHWVLQSKLILRNPVEVGLFRWTSQLQISAAGQIRLTNKLGLGPELMLAPLVGRQPHYGRPVIPAEALVVFTLQEGPLHLRIAGGTGIPLYTTDPAVGRQQLSRAPSSPVLRGFVEAAVHWGVRGSHRATASLPLSDRKATP